MRKGIQIGCVELLDEIAIKIVNQYVGLSLEEKPTIFFKFHGSEVGVEDEVRQVEEVVRQFEGGKFDWASEKKRRDQIWEGRKGALWATMAYKAENQVWTTDVCVPISRLADCIQTTKKDIEQSGLLAPIVGHVGDGNFHVLLSVDPNNDEEMNVAKGINHRMVQRAIDMEGTCTGEHGVGVGKRDFLDYELGQTTVETMRILKRALDPHGLLNPGKVFRLREGDGVQGEKKHDAHDQRPEHKAMISPAYESYAAAPVGKPEGEPPVSKHDATPPPRRM
jgi:D-lactate dehydrogenase (cytochrome)